MNPRMRASWQRGLLAQPLHPLRVDVGRSMCCPALLSPSPSCKLCSAKSDTPSPWRGPSPQSPLTCYRTSPQEQHRRHTSTEHENSMQISLDACILYCIRALGSLFRWLTEVVKGLAEQVVFFLVFFFMTGILVDWGSSVLQPSQPTSVADLMSLPYSSRPFLSSFRLNIWQTMGPTATERAVTQFLLDQIQHASEIASLSVSLGIPLLTLFEKHQHNVERFIMQTRVNTQHSQTGRTLNSPLTNLTRLLEVPLIDFTASGFIGKSFSHALDELDHLGSWSTQSPNLALKEEREARSRAIFWLTSSNLLLEYSSARRRVQELLFALRAAQQHLAPILEVIDERPHLWWRSIGSAHLSTEDSVRDLAVDLEAAIENSQRLVAYLDWIAEHLARSSLQDQLKSRNEANLSSCMAAFLKLFNKSTHPTSRQRCFCWEEYDDNPRSGSQRIGIRIPGTPTIQVR